MNYKNPQRYKNGDTKEFIMKKNNVLKNISMALVIAGIVKANIAIPVNAQTNKSLNVKITINGANARTLSHGENGHISASVKT